MLLCLCWYYKVITHRNHGLLGTVPSCVFASMQGCHAQSSHSQLFGFYDHHQDDYVTQNSKHRQEEEKIKSRDEFHSIIIIIMEMMITDMMINKS